MPDLICPHCPRTFTRASGLAVHVKAHQRTAKIVTPKIVDLVCKVCGKSFLKPQGLGSHAHRAHGGSPTKKIPSKRTFWTNEERELIADKMVSLRLADITAPIREIFCQAQTLVLPTDRLRLTLVPIPPDFINTVQDRVDAIMTEKKIPIIVEKEVVIRPDEDELLSRITTEKFVTHFAARLGGLLGSIERYVEDRLPTGTAKQVLYPVLHLRDDGSQKVRAPRILVIGLLPIQMSELRSKFIDRLVEFTFLEATEKIRELPTSSDFVLVHKHVSHAWWEAAREKYKSDRVEFVDGGVSNLASRVNAIIERFHRTHVTVQAHA